MKKILTAIALVTAASAFAADVGVSTFRDYAANKNGTSFSVGVTNGLGVSLSKVDNTYDRYAVTASKDLTSFAGVKVAGTVSGVYQNTVGNGKDGYGVVAGVQATYPITKGIDAVASVGRFYGQSRIDQFNGTNGSVGFKVKF